MRSTSCAYDVLYALCAVRAVRRAIVPRQAAERVPEYRSGVPVPDWLHFAPCPGLVLSLVVVRCKGQRPGSRQNNAGPPQPPSQYGQGHG